MLSSFNKGFLALISAIALHVKMSKNSYKKQPKAYYESDSDV